MTRDEMRATMMAGPYFSLPTYIHNEYSAPNMELVLNGSLGPTPPTPPAHDQGQFEQVCAEAIMQLNNSGYRTTNYQTKAPINEVWQDLKTDAYPF